MLSTWTLAICGVCLVTAALVHRLQLHSKTYTSSLLIPVEFILLIVVAVLVLTYLFYGVVLLTKKQWRELAIVGINIVVGIGSFLGAMAIDYPTLLYMT